MKYDFTQKSDWFDLTIVTATGQELHAPKQLLTNHSLYFQSLFSGDWADSSTKLADLSQFSFESVLLLLDTLSCQSTVLFSQKQKEEGVIDPKLLVEYFTLSEYLSIDFLLDPIRQGVFSQQYLAAAMDAAVLAKKTDLVIDWVAVPDGWNILTCISEKIRRSMIFTKENAKKIHKARTNSAFPARYREISQKHGMDKSLSNNSDECCELQQSIDVSLSSHSSVPPEQLIKLEHLFGCSFRSDPLPVLEACGRLGLDSSMTHVLRSTNLKAVIQFINSPNTTGKLIESLLVASSPDSALLSIEHIEIIERKFPSVFRQRKPQKRKLDYHSVE